MQTVSLSGLVLGWLGYFALHSAFASRTAKEWIAVHRPGVAPRYRLLYNLFAVLLLLPLLWLVYRAAGDPLWQWHGGWRWLMNGLAVAAVAGFAWSLHYYDMTEFLGLGQTPEQRRHFTLSPLHRYVRHPWYSFGLVLIWTRDMDPAWLVSCVAITLYLVVGSYWEEQKLVAEFGDVYRRYQRRVPAMIPRPRRHLSREEAAAMVAAANKSDSQP